MLLQAGVLLGKGRVVDDDVRLRPTPDHARPIQGKAAPVVLAADAAQQALVIAPVIAARWCVRDRFALALHHHLNAIGVNGVAGPQQRHPAHRAAIDVDAADAAGDLQPQTAVIQAELGQQQGAGSVIAKPDGARCMTHDALHPGPQGLVGMLALSKVN